MNWSGNWKPGQHRSNGRKATTRLVWSSRCVAMATRAITRAESDAAKGRAGICRARVRLIWRQPLGSWRIKGREDELSLVRMTRLIGMHVKILGRGRRSGVLRSRVRPIGPPRLDEGSRTREQTESSVDALICRANKADSFVMSPCPERSNIITTSCQFLVPSKQA